jgi:hypothetical protein
LLEDAAAAGESQASLAREHGISTALVCLICNGKVWRHLL